MTRKLAIALLLACVTFSAGAGVEIQVWHAMDGASRAELERLVARFNASEPAYRVVTAHKGSHDWTLASALAARGKPSAPHIVHVDETGNVDLAAQKATLRPLWEVMSQAGVRLEGQYAAALTGYYSDSRGRLLALPVATATPVLYYNRDAFRRAQLDPAAPPKTWYGMAGTLGALIDSGAACGLTTAWPSVLLENMSAWHNEPFAIRKDGGNGAAEDEAQLSFNGKLMVRWIATLASWRKAGYFTYAGRENEAEARFASGECALLTSSSASYPALRRRAEFDLGIAPLPYYEDFGGAPQNTLPGGAALWVMSDKPKADYRGVALFMAFLLGDHVQAQWHQRTGFLPLTRAAYELSRKQGFYASHPGEEVGVRQLLLKSATRDSQGVRLVRLGSVRRIINEELELVWADKKTPLAALNAAVARGNAMLDRR
ncbi:MAG: sn-glycerol-3-phosphate ABC transporter substrate-binding protein UgpB [Pseudomonadota bacterium]|nr:sn-glycerol-3-phosphate ABC transporter substrate-binding protein UgpB [Pseudomonadota bacterium]